MEEPPATDPTSAAPVPAAARYYAPAPETGYIEQRKLTSEALPQLPVQLTVRPDNPDRASFKLSPHANQARLIGDGLSQLREFFDFDLPAGRYSALRATGNGELRREPDGWRVVTKAKLNIS
ncbi:hypothetical protein [Hymenobacter siberiensis]|uniref:hypothetical protein n=1 Tax=Hymenobacter siberiensis TaxID=2848396 RepID=UPI001C1E741F|nr:hypothetical protein [Hymenobacter siberiensis]MBU6120726.1 hypothetical protein [Hymenobacter siberiensis]